MKKDYQTKTAAAATAVEAVMPDAVTVTVAELTGSLREGLLALAVGAGFQVMAAIIDDSVCGLAAWSCVLPFSNGNIAQLNPDGLCRIMPCAW